VPRLTSFTFQSINGFYKGPGEDVSWNRHGEEELAFSEAQLARGHRLVFGRRTYEHMAAVWRTIEAQARLPVIAAGMNQAAKIVVSNTLQQATWGPAQIVGGDVAAAFRALKDQAGPDMTLLGSGELLAFLARHGLVDALEIMIYPVAIGAGTPLFQGLTDLLDFRLVEHRVFASGSVLLTYAPRTPIGANS
jgi:dihydrofolate reductase